MMAHPEAVPGLYLSAIGDNWLIELNGETVRSDIHIDAEGNITSARNYLSVSFPIIRSLFHQGTNFLVFRIIGEPLSSRTGFFLNTSYYFDDYRNITKYHSQIYFIIAFTFFFSIGIAYLLIFAYNHADKYDLFYGLFVIMEGLYIMTRSAIIYNWIPDSDIVTRLQYASVYLMVPFLNFFFEELNYNHILFPAKIVSGFTAVCIALGFFMDRMFLDDLFTVWQYIIIVGTLYTFSHHMVYEFIRKTKAFYRQQNDEGIHLSAAGAIRYGIFKTELGNIFPGIFLLTLAVVLDAINILFFHIAVTYSRLGLFAFTLSGSWVLSRKYGALYRQVQEANAGLEETVRMRTQELEKQTRLANAASQAKSTFLARMSHEIRTPMNAILGTARLALRKVKDEALADDLRMIDHEGHNLLQIINDILDFSKIESGSLEINQSDYGLASLIQDTVGIIKVRIEEKPLSFNVNVAEGLPCTLYGDSFRIRQILINILTNAVKYTRRGSVNFSVKGEAHPTMDGRPAIELVFITQDTGIGIRDEDKEKLFHDFTRLDPVANRGVGGTGLGLVISARFAQAMGGSISMESVYGQGSTFTVRVPQEVRNSQTFVFEPDRRDLEKDEEFKIHFKAPRAKVLVVDDVETNLKVANGLIGLYGVNIDSASSGPEAIEKVKGTDYDIVFMDHMMPGMNGIEAAAKLRENGFKKTLVALTANAISGMREMFISKGFNDYLSKPVEADKLNDIMEKWLPDNYKEEIEQEEPVAEKPETDKPEIVKPSGEKSLVETLAGIPGLDVELALRRLAGMEDMYRNGIESMVSRYPALRDNLTRLLAEGNLKDFSMQAHAAKGLLGFIGHEQLSDRASELDVHARQEDADFCKDSLPPFLDDLGAFLTTVRKRLGLTPAMPRKDAAPSPSEQSQNP
jgi:signal transduction histidine kinase/CheY-like chemotaxis protein